MCVNETCLSLKNSPPKVTELRNGNCWLARAVGNLAKNFDRNRVFGSQHHQSTATFALKGFGLRVVAASSPVAALHPPGSKWLAVVAQSCPWWWLLWDAHSSLRASCFHDVSWIGRNFEVSQAFVSPSRGTKNPDLKTNG